MNDAIQVIDHIITTKLTDKTTTVEQIVDVILDAKSVNEGMGGALLTYEFQAFQNAMQGAANIADEDAKAELEAATDELCNATDFDLAMSNLAKIYAKLGCK